MRNLLILILIGSLSLCGSLLALGENPVMQTSSSPSGSPSDTPSKDNPQSENYDTPPPTVDLGHKIEGCTYTRDEQIEDMGFDSYECFNRVMHGVNVAAGGKCQSFALTDKNRKFLCFNDIARGGRNLQLYCANAWHPVGDKGDMKCEDKTAAPKSKVKKAVSPTSADH